MKTSQEWDWITARTLVAFPTMVAKAMRVSRENCEGFKWFKPRKGQFQLFYKWGAEHPEYQPDFVAEGTGNIFMLEVKRADQMEDEEVKAKRDVGVKWCELATDYARTSGEKTWEYALIPHDAIKDNMTIAGLVERYRCK